MHVVPKFEGEYSFLSNFHASPITVKAPEGGPNLVYPTGEAAFQAAKYHAMDPDYFIARLEYIESLTKAPTPAKAKYLGRAVKIDLDKWEEIKVKCMREVVFQKFQQNPELRVQLLKTGHAMLVEGNDWDDKFWGRCGGKGFNILGAILMEVRGYWLWTAQANGRAIQRDMG